VIDGLTGDQRFFLAFAQSWREKDPRRGAARTGQATDGHAPANSARRPCATSMPGIPRSQPKPGEKLYLAPKERVKIW
jgi:putative endopeptidase